MPIKQGSESFEEINQLVWQHLEARDWHQQPERNHATSIAIEAAELLEHYQWSDKPVGDKTARASELADILIYCFEYAQAAGIDMTAAIKAKLAHAAKKYPAEQFKGVKAQEARANWFKAREAHRQNKKGQEL